MITFQESNREDIRLLSENPQFLVVKYQNLIYAIVLKFIRIGYFTGQDKKDVLQCINEKLLLKMDNIRDHYNGYSLFKSYFAQIISNLCKETQKREKTKIVFVRMSREEMANLPYHGPVEDIFLEDEFFILNNILESYHDLQQKLELCLSVYFRIPFNITQLRKFCPDQNEEFYENSEIIATRLHNLSDKAVFELLAAIINRKTLKSNTKDCMRKWVKTKIGELVIQMNCSMGKSYYTMESFQVLFEKYITYKSKIRKLTEADCFNRRDPADYERRQDKHENAGCYRA